MAEGRPKYTEDEMKEILHRALAREQEGEDKISHEELIAAAGEIGLNRSAVDEAVKNFEADKRAAAQKEELERANSSEITEARKDALRGFVRSLLTYLVVGGGLFVVNQSVAHGAWWIWMMGAWGFAVLLRLISVITPSTKNYRRAERRAERRARREARQQAKQRIRESTREFERAVEKGVAHLLSATAKHIDEHVDAARKNRR